MPYTTVEMIGDVFIYLMIGDKQQSFCKIPAKELELQFENGVAQVPLQRWLVMQSGAYGKLDQHEAGLIRLRLAINRVIEEKNAVTPFEKWPFPAKRHGNVRTVRAYIFMCKNIPSADDDG